MKRTVLVLIWVVAVAPQVSAACFDFPENQIPACGFETDAEINQWIISSDSTILTASPVHSGIGAAYLVSSTNLSWEEIEVESACLTPSGSGAMGHGIYVFPVTGPVPCMAVIFAYTSASDCTGPIVPITGFPSEIPPGDWTLVSFGETVDIWPSAKFNLYCGSTDPFEVVVDDAFWGEGMVPVTLQTFVIE